MPEECAPLVVFLASDAAAGITGQAIGIGGDRLSLYSHPAEAAHAFHEGGWSAEQIAAGWQAAFEGSIQSYGVSLPPL
jgi:3-oxoacyl-[acyl-carrier protein] reductase